MPVQLTKDAFPLDVEEIRMFLRDQPDYNILMDDIEFENTDIERAMRLTVAKWNATTPITNLTSPAQLNEYVLLCGVCCILLRSEGLRQVRNQFVTQDGNISQVGLDEKEALYLKWAMYFCEEFERLAKEMKIQQNMESLLDDRCGGESGFGSGYRWIGRYTR